MAELAVGTEFAGYRLEAVAGRGGMGVVYRARNLITDQERALKVIAPELSTDVRFRDRFKRESRLAAKLEHPNVIPIYEAREHDGHLLLVMRYVTGSDLSAVLRAEGPLRPERALAILTQVAAALDAAHGQGLVHRDVKPANVLLAAGGGREHAYLTDFGLVKDLSSDSSLTATGVFMGTYQYAAPEQIDPAGGKPLDRRADVYALGGVLYHSLAGEVPFPRDSIQALIAAHLFMPPPDIRERRPDLPPPLSEVIGRALAKDPDERFATAGALVEAAAAALATAPPAEAPGADVTAVRRPESDDAKTERQPPGGGTRRRRLIAGGVAVVVLIGAVLSVALLASGDGDAPSSGTTATDTRAQASPTATSSGGARDVRGQIVLRPVGGAKATGVATAVEQGDEVTLAVVGELPPLPRSQREAAYNVWLYNSRADARSLGAQFTTPDGTYRGQAALPADYTRFRYLDISRQPFGGGGQQHSGDSLLRGRIDELERG